MPTLAPQTARAINRSDSGIALLRAGSSAPRPGEATIRLAALGLGSPDFAIAAGRIPFRGTIGREFVGTVELIEPRPGRDADTRLIGTRVVGQSFIPCGTCDCCRGGLSGVCPSRIHPGLHGRDGCGADLFTFPIACLHAVPAGVSDEAAILSYSLAAALSALHACTADPRALLTVLGDGAVGLLAAQVASHKYPRIRLLGLHPPKFDLCERWGIKHRHVRDAGARHDQHAVIDCTHSPDGLAAAAGLILPRGRILRVTHGIATDLSDAGSPPDLARAMSAALANEVVIAGASPPTPAEALAYLASGRLDITGLITRRFSFDDASAALVAAAEPGTVKAILAV